MKSLYFFFIFVLLVVTNISAQGIHSLDSLEDVFETTKDTLNKINAGRRLWYTNLRFYNFCLYNNDAYKKNVQYYQNELVPLELLCNKLPVRFTKEIDQMVYKMEAYQYNLDYDSLLFVGKQIRKKINKQTEGLVSNKQTELLISLMVYQAEVVSFNNDINKAISILIEALSIAEQKNLLASQIRVKYSISKLLLYNFSKNQYAYDKAFDILRDIKQQVELVDDTEVFNKTKYREKIDYFFEEDYPTKDSGFFIHLDSYLVYLFGEDLYNDLQNKLYYYNNLDSNYVNKKIEKLNAIEAILESHNFENTYLYAQLQNSIGYLYYTLGNYKNAYRYLNWVYEILETKAYVNTRLFDYEQLYTTLEQTSKALGQYEQAYKFALEANDYKLKKSDNSFVSVINLIKAYENSRIQKLQEDINSQRIKKLIAYFALALIAIAVTFFIISYRSYVKNHKILTNKNIELERTIHENLELEKKIENIQTAIAKDLHDNFGNRISNIVTTHSILKDINENKTKINQDSFTHFSNSLEECLCRLTQDIKDLIWVNNKDNNSLKKVIKRIKTYVDEESHNQITKVCLLLNLEQNDYRLPKFWNRQLLLIIKEAINNALKHANATKIDVSITVTNSNILVVKCVDNGVGFDFKELNRVSGLDNMKTRAASIDCELSFVSEKNKGTSISLSGRIKNF